jgi:hypothetical protein
MKISRTASFRTRVEEAVAQTLSNRFRSVIPKLVPDCYIDTLPRSPEKNLNFAIFPKTGQIEPLKSNASESSAFLAARKVKTLGILDPYCASKTFIADGPNELQKEILLHSQSYETLTNSENAITDSFIFQTATNRYFGYTNTLLPHSRAQIHSRFAPFFESGGSIVSVQDRILPITRTAIDKEGDRIASVLAALFCEISDHMIQIWIVMNCGDNVITPLVSESSADTASTEFLINSVITQTEKQYRLWNPTLAVLINASESEDSAAHNDIRELLSKSCNGELIELDKNVSRNASLYGAVLLGGE